MMTKTLQQQLDECKRVLDATRAELKRVQDELATALAESESRRIDLRQIQGQLAEAQVQTELHRAERAEAECVRLRVQLLQTKQTIRNLALGKLAGDARTIALNVVARITAALAAQPNSANSDNADSFCLLHTDTRLEWLENDPLGRLCRCPKCDAAQLEVMQ